MLLGPNFCMKSALLLLTSPGITISAGPRLPALVYSTGLYIALSAASFVFCDVEVCGTGLSNFGWAKTVPANATAKPTAAKRTNCEFLIFISCPPDQSCTKYEFGCGPPQY